MLFMIDLMAAIDAVGSNDHAVGIHGTDDATVGVIGADNGTIPDMMTKMAYGTIL